MRLRTAALAAAGSVVLAGCTAGPGGDRSASSSSGAPGTVTVSRSATRPPPSAPTPTPTPTTPVATASVAQPPDPVVRPGNAGAWTLTRAAPGDPQAQQVRSVSCGQDGSVVAAGLRLSAGGATFALDDPAVTVTGTADVDAAGGTFRGRDADTAITFTWTC